MLYAPTYALPCCMHLLMHFNAVCKYLCSSMLYASPGALPCRRHLLMHFHAGCTYWCTSMLEEPTDALPWWRNLLMHIHTGGIYLEATWWAYGKYIITLLWVYPFNFMNLLVFLNWECGAYNTIKLLVIYYLNLNWVSLLVTNPYWCIYKTKQNPPLNNLYCKNFKSVIRFYKPSLI